MIMKWFVLILIFVPFCQGISQYQIIDSTFSSRSNLDYSYISGKKMLYVKGPQGIQPMDDKLFYRTIETSAWSNVIYERSTGTEMVSDVFAGIGGAGVLATCLIAGFTSRFEIPMDNRVGMFTFGISGGTAVLGGLGWLATHTLHKYQRRKYIRIYNKDKQHPFKGFF